MALSTWITTLSLSAVMVAAAPAASKNSNCACVPGKPTAASNTWNFKAETDHIFKQIRDDAQRASYRADKIESFTMDPNLDWTASAEQLSFLKHDINDMGAKVCRLAQIRSADAPWQQAEIKRLHTDLTLLANSTDDAIRFGSNHENQLWRPFYQKDTQIIYRETQKLQKSIDAAAEYASASKDYHSAKQELGNKKS